MSTHLSDAQLMDVLDGVASERDEHLGECAACRERLAEARGGWSLAQGADVPEPPAAYWETFPRQVGRRLGERPRPWGRWLWPALAAAAAALVLVALPHRDRGPVAPAPAPVLPAWSALPPATEDPSLAIVESVAAHLEPEAECGGVDDCVADLSDEEGGTLAALLRTETARRPS
jgi:hypothetical protein